MGEPYRKSARYYDDFYLKILDYEKQCDVLEQIFDAHGIDGGSRVLDLACGTGTHCISLAKRGYEVAGVDISPGMISEAKKKAGEAENPTFAVQDMRNLDLNRTFDVVLCMFGGFGYLNEDGDLDRLFTGLKKHLRRGGLFLFEFWNVGGLKETPYRTWRKVEMDDGMFYHISESNFDMKSSILDISIEFLITRGNRVVDDIVERHKIRIYYLHEIRRLLSVNGFEMLDFYGGVGGGSLDIPDKNEFRIFTVAGFK